MVTRKPLLNRGFVAVTEAADGLDWVPECERYGLRRARRDEDRGELSTPSGEGEPENRQQEEPAEP